MPKGTPSDRFRPKIALLITEMQMGGAAKVVRDQAAAFRPFANVREIVFNRADGVDFEGEAVVSLDVGGGGGAINRLTNFARRVRRYGRFKEQWKPDVSIAHLEGAHYVDVASRRDEKVVAVVHGSIRHNREIRGPLGAIRRHVLIPAALRRADRVVAVSRDIAVELADAGIPRVQVINNFFDVDGISRLSREPIASHQIRLFAGPPVIVTAGRLAPQKNQAPLIEAFAELRRRRDARLLFLGDGPLRDELVRKATDLGLTVSTPWTVTDPDADVHFLGVKANPLNLVARSAVFVLPSSSEGFPLALCEAMACRTTVVSADCPTGPREILSPDSKGLSEPITDSEQGPFGYLMPIPRSGHNSISVWADTLDKLLDDNSGRAILAEAGWRRVHDFTAETTVPRWRALIDELLETSANNRS